MDDPKLSCPVRGCGREKEAVQVVCNGCWERVPSAVRLELFKANSRRKAAMPKEGTEFSGQRLRIATEDHDRAQRAAAMTAQMGGGA